MNTNRFPNPWPPVSPVDERFYDIELLDGSVVLNVEYWAFGGGFGPRTGPMNVGNLVRFPMDKIKSFALRY